MPPPATRIVFPDLEIVVAADFPPITTSAAPRETSGALGTSVVVVEVATDFELSVEITLDGEVVDVDAVSGFLFGPIPDGVVLAVESTGLPEEDGAVTVVSVAMVVDVAMVVAVAMVVETAVVLVAAAMVVVVVVAMLAVSANEIMVAPDVPLYVVVIGPTTRLPERPVAAAKRVPLSLNPKVCTYPWLVAVSVESAQRKAPDDEYEAIKPSPMLPIPAVTRVVVPKTAFLVVAPNAPKYPEI